MMGDFLDFFKNKKNLGSVLLLGILILALPLLKNTLEKQKIIKSRATEDPIVFVADDNVSQKDGKWIAKKPQVSLKLTSPLGPAGTAAPAPSVSPAVKQLVQWFADSGTYALSGNISPASSSVSIQADEYTGNTYISTHNNNTTFTIPSGNRIAVILRVNNTSATFSNVSLIKQQEGNNIAKSSGPITLTATTGNGGIRNITTSQKFKIYGDVSGDGYIDAAEWTSDNQWVASNKVGDPAFGISAAGNWLQVGLNVRSGSVTFSNIRFVEVTQSANLLNSNMQNATLSGGS